MKSIKNILSTGLLSFLWFIISPFPFENGGWSLFGGYKLLKQWLPFTDPFERESAISKVYYSSTIYPVLLLLASIVLGYLTLRFIVKFSGRTV